MDKGQRKGETHLAISFRSSALKPSLVVLGACAIIVTASCSKPEAVNNIKQEYAAKYDVEPVSVPSFDGVGLSSFIIKKQGLSGKLPVILVRTPYEIWEDEIGESKPYIEGLLNSGYAIFIQNERGRYGSGGRYTKTIPFAREDGVATLDWIVKQSWSTGRVGTFGCSSSAENQMALAQANHPAHVAMVPRSAAVAMTEAQATNVREPGQSRRGGVFWLGGWASWFYDYGKLDSEGQPPVGIPTPEKELADDWQNTSRGFPQIDIMKRLGVTPTEFEDYVKRPVLDPVWSDGRISDQDDIKIPTLWITSWFDYAPQLEIGVFEANRKRAEVRGTNDQKLLIGAGLHCQQGLGEKGDTVGERDVGDMRYDYVQRVVTWFDAFVKELPSAKQQTQAMAPVTSYNNGTQSWQSSPRWPDSALAKQYCLDNRNGMSLIEGACMATNSSVAYRHDPLNPVPTTGGGGYPEELGTKFPLGAADQSRLASRNDVKTFLLPPLSKDVEVFGNIQAVIWASADVADIDIFAKLVEVLPNGKTFNVADTALRARYRNGYEKESFLSSGVPVEMKLATMVSRHTFRKGSKIGIQISSSNWPQFSINTGTRLMPELERKPLSANIRIWSGQRYPSRIILPVQRDSKPDAK